MVHVLRSCENRFSSKDDRKRALMSRLLQRKLFHDLLSIDYDSIRIERTPTGKPYLVSVPNARLPHLNFNVSHDGDYVVIVSDPVSLVGTDIISRHSHSDLLPEKLFENFTTYFTPFEWMIIRSGGPDSDSMLDQFYRHWCMKEAYVKAVGVGLGFELHRAEFHYDKDMIWGDLAHVYIDGIVATEWQFFLHKLDPEHWVCVATGPPSVRPSSAPAVANNDGESCHRTVFQSRSFTFLRVEDVLKEFGLQAASYDCGEYRIGADSENERRESTAPLSSS